MRATNRTRIVVGAIELVAPQRFSGIASGVWAVTTGACSELSKGHRRLGCLVRSPVLGKSGDR
jgi:hypothetical protein